MDSDGLFIKKTDFYVFYGYKYMRTFRNGSEWSRLDGSDPEYILKKYPLPTKPQKRVSEFRKPKKVSESIPEALRRVLKDEK